MHVYADTFKGQKKLGLLELELQVIVSFQNWVLEGEFRTPERACAQLLNYVSILERYLV